MKSETVSLKQIQRLSQTLLISVVLNVFLLALLFYFLIKESPPRPYVSLKPFENVAKESTLSAEHHLTLAIKERQERSWSQLLLELEQKEIIENGYTQRDLALAVLVTFHHFDIQRVFGPTLELQRRYISIVRPQDGKKMGIVIYPGLNDEQFQQILQFANRERWPLTNKGLFFTLRKQKEQPDPSLLDTFYLTPEFLAVETLFSRAPIPVSKSEILKLIFEGTWAMLAKFSEQQKISQDLSAARRQRFLLEYLARNSSYAAQLLLRTDGAFAIRKLDDHQVIQLIHLLNEKTALAQKFSLVMLASPRSDAVRKAAACRLYQFAGEAPPETDLQRSALLKFLPKRQADKTITKTHVLSKPKIVASADIAYVVQTGDSLWKIAKRFKVSTDSIRKRNKLSSDCLKPGTTLYIPRKD